MDRGISGERGGPLLALRQPLSGGVRIVPPARGSILGYPINGEESVPQLVTDRLRCLLGAALADLVTSALSGTWTIFLGGCSSSASTSSR